MVVDQVKRVLVWPKWWRWVHALLVVLMLAVLVSAALLSSDFVAQNGLFDILLLEVHLPAAYGLTLLVIFRFFYLLVDRGIGSYKSLFLTREKRAGAFTMLRLYLSFLRTALPNYYAHNPLWSLIYLGFWVALVLQLMSGYILDQSALRSLFSVSLSQALLWHSLLNSAFVMFVVLHVVTAIIQDIKGTGSDISATLNGHRIFMIESQQPAGKRSVPNTSISLRVDEIQPLNKRI